MQEVNTENTDQPRSTHVDFSPTTLERVGPLQNASQGLKHVLEQYIDVDLNFSIVLAYLPVSLVIKIMKQPVP